MDREQINWWLEAKLGATLGATLSISVWLEQIDHIYAQIASLAVHTGMIATGVLAVYKLFDYLRKRHFTKKP